MKGFVLRRVCDDLSLAGYFSTRLARVGFRDGLRRGMATFNSRCGRAEEWPAVARKAGAPDPRVETMG